MQGIVMGAAQMLTQGFLNCTNFQDMDSARVRRHGLPNRLQTSSCGARKVLGAIPQQNKHHQDGQARLCENATQQEQQLF